VDLCNASQNYKAKLGADFHKSIPTVWDETRVISAKVAKHIVIALRSGNKWYLTAMYGDDSFGTSIQLSFLSSGNWNVESYSDDFEKYKPDTVIFKKEIIRSTNKLSIKFCRRFCSSNL
jgi:alpha-glucosidase